MQFCQLLLSGVRSVEIDTWDEGDTIIVTHGRARCTFVPFEVRHLYYSVKTIMHRRKSEVIKIIISGRVVCNKGLSLRVL